MQKLEDLPQITPLQDFAVAATDRYLFVVGGSF
jgi:hypothetical protein